jgi:saccharopine dehydrogenase (NAD+, L-lysine-forming)
VRVLLIGTGGVGEAIALTARGRPWLDAMVLADHRVERAVEVQARTGDPARFPVESVDANDPASVGELARRHGADLVMNAVDPSFARSVFDAAFEAGCSYLDMAMTLSRPHPDRPYQDCGVKLGDEQFQRAADWEERGQLALVGMGVEPGLSDVFAAYAAKHLFDPGGIDQIGVRDGADLQVRGHAFAPTFSIWTTIEECLNPPVIWERGRGWFTTGTFSEPEVFVFPDGIGPVECVNVEHEEVVLVPRWIECGRVTFKYGLGAEFIEVLKTLHLLGLDRTEPVTVKGVQVSPRDVVAAVLPDPATLGDRMTGKTCAGTWITGLHGGRRREVYLYQVADNERTMAEHGLQAVVWQTGVNPVIAMELLAEGVWSGAGVFGPEAFDPDPFVERMPAYGFPWGIRDSADAGDR